MRTRVINARLPVAASFILREEARYRLTLEALADVDAKRTTNHAGIERWARSLGKARRPRGK
jgi:hypothetical protein